MKPLIVILHNRTRPESRRLAEWTRLALLLTGWEVEPAGFEDLGRLRWRRFSRGFRKRLHLVYGIAATPEEQREAHRAARVLGVPLLLDLRLTSSPLSVAIRPDSRTRLLVLLEQEGEGADRWRAHAVPCELPPLPLAGAPLTGSAINESWKVNGLVRSLRERPRVGPLEEIPFDRYQRFQMTRELVASLDAAPLDILDVGGDDYLLAEFLPQHRLFMVDRSTGFDGTSLPFADRTFDVTVSIDVLEHLPPAAREPFVRELVRTGRRLAILACPTALSREAERYVAGVTRDPWLKEHALHGLPTEEEVEGILARGRLRFEKHPNGYLPSWTAMMLVNYHTRGETRRRHNRFYNTRAYSLDNRSPAYRTIFTIRLD